MVFSMRMQSGALVQTIADEVIPLGGTDGFALHLELEQDWRVSHMETGFLIARANTRRDVLEAASEKVQAMAVKHGTVEAWLDLNRRRAGLKK